MKKLIVYHGDSPECIEGFSKECVRSCKGSLHVHPSKPTTVTSDEHEHILKKYPHMKSKLRVVAEIKESKKEEVKKAPKPITPKKDSVEDSKKVDVDTSKKESEKQTSDNQKKKSGKK